MGLGEQFVPESQREIGMGSAEDGDEMILESLDGAFGCESSMLVRWDELEVNILGSYGSLESRRGFVVKALDLGPAAPIDQV